VVFANLIGNALKHGGSPVRVTVRQGVGPTGVGEVVVQVNDSGPGIPEEVLPHVFDRFYKADKGRARSEGSGLGLSIAMANAQIHGGTITAANGEQGGAVFTLRLPLRPAAAGAPVTGPGAGAGTVPGQGAGGGTGGPGSAGGAQGSADSGGSGDATERRSEQ
jgi:two-component system sensor histidine kinase MtrB